MSPRSILVVDDDADMRELVSELLGRAGHDVRQAVDGREGLRELFRRAPDLVVLDVSMPELDGWATLERIREVSEVPVLMLTAQTGELEKVRGLRGGADDYVGKPFGRQELLARVEALLRRAAPAAAVSDAWSDGWLEIDHARRTVRAGTDDADTDAARVPPARGASRSTAARCSSPTSCSSSSGATPRRMRATR